MIKKVYKRFLLIPLHQRWIIFLLIILGLFLRLYPDPHRIIWSYDQARDSFFMRSIIQEKNFILLGPQTEYYGLFHGPIYYYLLAPFYLLSKGEVLLPSFAMTLLTFSSAIPLALLAVRVTKNSISGILTIFIFSVSYPFIEYARWLSNISIALPMLSWSYFFFYKSLFEKKKDVWTPVLLGIFIGFAVQAEIFFLAFAGFVLIVLIFLKKDFVKIARYSGGVLIGVLPLVIAEFKFNFRGTKILFADVLGKSRGGPSNLVEAGSTYLNHIALVTENTIGGNQISAIFIFLVLIGGGLLFKGKKLKKDIFLSIWILTIVASHAVLFAFAIIDAVFLDMGVAILLLVLFGIFLSRLLLKNPKLTILLIVLFFLFQLNQYSTFVLEKRPFNHYGFIQEPSTLSHKEEIITEIFKGAKDEDFTFASIGTPYGVRSVWASVFEIYSRKNKVDIPKWYGYYANGYPGEEILEPVDRPGNLHVLVIESNIDELLAESIIGEELGNQNNHTKIVSEIELYDTKIQFRRKK